MLTVKVIFKATAKRVCLLGQLRCASGGLKEASKAFDKKPLYLDAQATTPIDPRKCCTRNLIR